MTRKIIVALFALGLWFAGAETVHAIAAPFQVQEREEWMGIYFKGHKAGFSSMTIKRHGKDIQILSRVYFRMRAESIDQVTSFTQEAVLDENLEPKSFTLLQEIMGNRHQTLAKIVGGKLEMTVSSTGYEKEESQPMKSGAALSSTYFLNILKNGLEAGRKGRFPIFLEIFRTFSDLEYEIQGKQAIPHEDKMVDAFVIRQTLAGMETALWVTPDGVVLREASQDGFESIREPREKAVELKGEAVPLGSLITMSLVKPEREIEDPGNRLELKARLLNLRSPKAVPEDHRQRVLGAEPEKDGTFAVTLQIRSEPPDVANPQFPKTFPQPELLSDTSEIQSKHPMIRALAREIVAKDKDAWEAAQEINKWVYNNMEKALVDTLTALDALNQRRGECQAHTNLFVALARASGIPARVVNGLVYSREYKGFVYHAWPEVYVGEWRSLDPTFGQNRVDATHIKLGEGEQEAPLKLMGFIGKLRITLPEGTESP